jgi:hypothetical protein
MELRFTSALSPADLIGRLQKGAKAAADPPAPGAAPPLTIKFNGMEFTLGKIRGYRDDLAPRFCGIVLEQGRGSVIIGKFRPHPALSVALCLALLIVGMLTLPSGPGRLNHPALLITPCAFLVTAGVIALSRWMGLGEKNLLTDYLEACCRDQGPHPA